MSYLITNRDGIKPPLSPEGLLKQKTPYEDFSTAASCLHKGDYPMKLISKCTAFLIISLLGFAPLSALAKPTGSELYEAALFQDLPKVQSLLAAGADANHLERGRPVLGWAAQSGNVEVVEALIKGGANPNIADEGIGHTPLMRAIDTQFIEIVRALLKAKADPNAVNSQGESCLIMAVKSRKPEIVQALIDGGANVNFVTKDGDSPALAAAQDGMPESLEIIKLLGKAKSNLNVSNIIYTPLVYAIEQGNKDLVKTLLDAGANPNAKTQSEALPIFKAIDNPELLEILVAAKADLNATNTVGETPLFDAVRNGNLPAVKALLAGGANTQVTDSSGTTPLQLAEQYSQSEIAELLKPKSQAANDQEPVGGYKVYAAESSDGGCSVADAARQQMELHGKLQARVNAGTMSDEIFRTFNKDTEGYGEMLATNPAAACELFAQLTKKYGVQ